MFEHYKKFQLFSTSPKPAKFMHRHETNKFCTALTGNTSGEKVESPHVLQSTVRSGVPVYFSRRRQKAAQQSRSSGPISSGNGTTSSDNTVSMHQLAQVTVLTSRKVLAPPSKTLPSVPKEVEISVKYFSHQNCFKLNVRKYLL